MSAGVFATSVAVMMVVAASDGGQAAPTSRVDVLWGRFSLEVPPDVRRQMVDRPDLLEADGFPRDERIWLDLVPSGAEPTFMLVVEELGALEGKSGLLKNMNALARLSNDEARLTRKGQRSALCGSSACVEYDGTSAGENERFVLGFLVAVGGEVLSVDFITFGIRGDLSPWRDRARALMASFVPGNRRLRTGDRVEAPAKGCCGNTRLTFPTPPGFYFQARMTPYFKTFEVQEFSDPEKPQPNPIRVVWLVGDASTSPTSKSVPGSLWGTSLRWVVEESGSLSHAFWNFDLDPRHNKLIVEGLRKRAKETQALVNGIDWDGIELFKKAQKAR